MNAYLPPSARRGFRIAALIAAVICVLAITAGAFVVSYTGVRDMALTAGVTAHYARFYPWIFDAVFVVAAVAALSLRGVLRAYAWLAILVILGAVAAADAIHAMSIALPKRPTEATVAATPWAVLLIGFTLLYAMARQALPTRRAAAAATSTSNGLAANGGQPTQVPLSALLADKPAARPERAQAALTARPATATAATPHPPAKTEPLAPETEPITKTERVAPKTESVTPKTEPVITKTEPVAPNTELAATKTEPITPESEPLATKTEPITPESEPLATTTEPTAPRTVPLTTRTESAAPKTEPAATKSEPVSAKPAAAEPVTTEPVKSEPVTVARTEPVSTDFTSAEPASTGPVSAGTEPVTPAPAPPPGPEPVASPVGPYPGRTQQFAVRRPPMVARPFTEPELPVRRPTERDDPSDADAEPVEPAAHFNRLRSSPTPPDED